jgi:hypothetical protein
MDITGLHSVTFLKRIFLGKMLQYIKKEEDGVDGEWKIWDEQNKDLGLKRDDGSEVKEGEYKRKVKQRSDDGNWYKT